MHPARFSALSAASLDHAYVSNPRHVERSVCFSDSTLIYLLHLKGYGTYLGRFSAETTEPYSCCSFKVSYSHRPLHRIQPKPFREPSSDGAGFSLQPGLECSQRTRWHAQPRSKSPSHGRIGLIKLITRSTGWDCWRRNTSLSFRSSAVHRRKACSPDAPSTTDAAGNRIRASRSSRRGQGHFQAACLAPPGPHRLNRASFAWRLPPIQ